MKFFQGKSVLKREDLQWFLGALTWLPRILFQDFLKSKVYETAPYEIEKLPTEVQKNTIPQKIVTAVFAN